MSVEYNDPINDIKVERLKRNGTDLLPYYKNDVLFSQLYPDNPLKSNFYLLPSIIAASNKSKRILLLGVGLGGLVIQLHKLLPNSIITAVDIDPASIFLAEKYVGSHNVIYKCENAMTFVKQENLNFDYIVCDICTGKKLAQLCDPGGFPKEFANKS